MSAAADQYNPRYLCYAYAHGKSPEEMLGHDRLRYPGQAMYFYIGWMDGLWEIWRQESGRSPLVQPRDYAEFDAWLMAQYPTDKPSEEAL